MDWDAFVPGCVRWGKTEEPDPEIDENDEFEDDDDDFDDSDDDEEE